MAVHLALAVLLWEVPIFEARQFRGGTQVSVVRKVTPLYAPVLEPTQNEPNKAKVNRDFDVDSLQPRPAVQIPDGPPSTTRQAARNPVPIPEPRVEAPPKPLAEPPRVDTELQARTIMPPQLGMPDAPQPPPIQTQEKPKLAFEAIGAGGYGNQPAQGPRRVPMPTTSVTEAVAAVARSRASAGMQALWISASTLAGERTSDSFERRARCAAPSMLVSACGPRTCVITAAKPPGPFLRNSLSRSSTSRPVSAPLITSPRPGTWRDGPSRRTAFWKVHATGCAARFTSA